MSVRVAKPTIAPVVTGPSTVRATRPEASIPQWMIDESRSVEAEPFKPEEHIDFKMPESILSMKEIGLEGCGVSLNAASSPFSLFSNEAIKQMRREIFSQTVLQDCQYSSSFNKNLIRGMNHERAPFTYDAWKSPELLEKLSAVAGIDVDETVLTRVRGISTLPELYEQCTEYRLEILKDRLDDKIAAEKSRRQDKQQTFELDEVRAFLAEQRDFLDSMVTELV